MATLHVRNVPEGIYDALRDRAGVNGRSIGAEAIMILGGELGPQALLGRMKRTGRRGRVDMFDRFSPRGKQVVLDAQDTARELRLTSVDTDHLLLGLLHPPENVASAILANLGVTRDAVVAAIEIPESETEDVTGGLPFTPAAKQSLELALRACINQRSLQIEPHHILYGVLQAEDGPGARILRAMGQSLATVTRAMVEMGGGSALRFEPAEYGFRVLELTGDAADWERELNAQAARGHELLEIMDGRAIFTVRMSGP